MKADKLRRRRPALPTPPLLHRACIQVKDHDIRLHGQPHAGPSLLRKCNIIVYFYKQKTMKNNLENQPFVPQWGQFLAHDLTATPVVEGKPR